MIQFRTLLLVFSILSKIASLEACNSTYTGNSGEIKSPNYPSSYGYNTKCYYNISTPISTVVQLTFKVFELNLHVDSITVYDGNSFESRPMGTYKKSQPPPVFRSTSNSLLLMFTTDHTLVAQGFLAEFVAMSIPPNLPRHVIVTPESSSSLRVTWEPPAVTNEPVLSYKVTLAPLSPKYPPAPGCLVPPPMYSTYAEIKMPDHAVTINYLYPATEYKVSVSAENAVGYGNASVPIRVITKQGVSQSVRDFAVEVKADLVTFTWRAPCITNGDLSHFLLVVEDARSTNQTRTVSVSQPMVESYSSAVPTISLTAESQCTATLTPVGTSGLYGINRTIIVHMPARLPTQPRGVIVTTVSSSEVQVEWLPPDQTHGTILNYTVTLRPLNRHLHLAVETFNGSTYKADIRHLHEDTHWEVSVVAATAVGYGPPGTNQGYTLPPTPILPGVLIAVFGSLSIFSVIALYRIKKRKRRLQEVELTPSDVIAEITTKRNLEQD